MKIALYVAELDIKGGTHKQVLRLAEYLQDAGHEVAIWTPFYDLPRTYAGFANIKVHSLSGHAGRVLPYLRLAFALARCDVLHVHDNRGVLFFFIAKLLRRARVFVWQINDLHPSFGLGHSKKLTLRRRSVINRIANRVMAKTVDAITVNVGKNVDRVADVLRVPAHLYYCGVDLPSRLSVSSTRSSEPSAERSQTPFRLLSTGTFARYRNYEVLIESAALASKRLGRTVDVTIVGDARGDPSYAEQIRSLAEQRSINLSVMDNLTDEAFTEQFRQCHVFVFVNVDQSWGLAVFEAAAAGKPVVLSKSVGAAEVLTGKPGFLTVDPLSVMETTDAIVSLLGDLPAAIEAGGHARLAVEKMSWADSYGRPVESLYVELASV